MIEKGYSGVSRPFLSGLFENSELKFNSNDVRGGVQLAVEIALMDHDYKEIILNEFLRRRGIQITYTLRQYSKELGVNYVQLQQIIHSTKGLSKAKAFGVGRAMGLSHTECIVFRYMVSAESGRSKAERTFARQKLRSIKTKLKCRWQN